jgi:hypothetical protein
MKIQLKRSNVLEAGAAKKPTAGQMEYGELAVNYNTSDTAIFLKDSADQIVRVGGFKAGDNINIDGDGNISADASFWEENAGKLYPKTLTNNVGIGNNNPQEKLDVTGNGKFSGNLNVTGNGTYTGKVTSASTEASDSGTTLVTKDFLDSELGSVDSSNWIEDSGKLYPKTLTNNVGIGTDNPQSKLDVNGSATFNGTITSTVQADENAFIIRSANGAKIVSQYYKDAGDGAVFTLSDVSGTAGVTLRGSTGEGVFTGSIRSPHFDLENLPSLP